jgi:hypothetical protein
LIKGIREILTGPSVPLDTCLLMGDPAEWLRCLKIEATLFLQLLQDSLDYLEPSESDKLPVTFQTKQTIY